MTTPSVILRPTILLMGSSLKNWFRFLSFDLVEGGRLHGKEQFLSNIPRHDPLKRGNENRRCRTTVLTEGFSFGLFRFGGAAQLVPKRKTGGLQS
ncbi:hypothetical protein RM543_14205 [Roseicyclus sp. F158]|uniref:Uncharacterized protein n=1 Tax=Tropicimonas omnivorans TaxID=3075590 RepID=A0ABU3DJK7_9RHOB|nr:hypothetical protein [Roseicyclus sp. F158]MDT0683841.1 hypothetical protein [Roseicyclus sp. F158]